MRWVRLNESGVVDLDSDQSKRDDCIQAPDNVSIGWQLVDDVWNDPQAEEKRISSIKTEAGRIIISRFPSWKQRNMNREYAKLQGKWLILPLTEDRARMDRLEADFAWMEAVSAESDRLEEDPNATPNWPEYE